MRGNARALSHGRELRPGDFAVPDPRADPAIRSGDHVLFADQVRVLHGSTNYLKEGFGSYGSRATVMGGSAVVLAVEDMLKAFRDATAQKFSVADRSRALG